MSTITGTGGGIVGLIFFGRVCFLFFDRMTRMMRMRLMIMIRTTREMIMIVRVDRTLTMKDS